MEKKEKRKINASFWISFSTLIASLIFSSISIYFSCRAKNISEESNQIAKESKEISANANTISNDSNELSKKANELSKDSNKKAEDSNKISLDTYKQLIEESSLLNRPYICVDTIETLTDPNTKLKHPQVYVKNVGNIPAKVTDMFCYLYNQSIPMSLKDKTALVYPGQTGVSIEVDRTFEENKSPTLRIRIEYQDYSGREYYYDVTYRFIENLWIYIDSSAN